MAFKHHHQSVSLEQEAAIGSQSLVRISEVSVYDTKFSYPSTGAFIYTSGISDEFPNSVSYLDLVAETTDMSGVVSNFIFDWDGGGPEGITKKYWQSIFSGAVCNIDLDVCSQIQFKFVYSGSIFASASSSPLDFTDFASDNLTTTLLNTWTYSELNSDKVRSTTETFNIVPTADTSTYHAISFRLRFWNSSGSPLLVVFVKRVGQDDDFVLLSPSTICNSLTDIDYDNRTSVTKTVLDNVKSWTISRDHNSINAATFSVFVPNSSSAYAYIDSADGFGVLSKGNLIKIKAGYKSTGLSDRFIGNIAQNINVSRSPRGATITFSCEGLLSFALDTLNYNFPNKASYAYAGYLSNTNLYAYPNGVSRPSYYDQWNLTTAVKSLLVQSNIDPFYLYKKRRYEIDATDAVSFADDRPFLLTELGINLSRNAYISLYQEDIYKDPLWKYDFGSDTAYDIIKDMLTKYGYYISEIGCGVDCGAIEIVGINVPVNTVSKPTSRTTGTGYGVKHKSAENFLYTEINYNYAAFDGTATYDLTGKSFDIITGVGPYLSDEVLVKYSEDKINSTNISGTIHNGLVTQSAYIDLIADTEKFFYDSIVSSTGYNETVYRPFFGIDSNGYIDTDLTYGEHSLIITNESMTPRYAPINVIRIYDFGSVPYKKYTTKNYIQNLEVEHLVDDIRNDIVVLGASTGTFAYVNDSSSSSTVEEKYITSRAVDANSIYNKDYKYYIGRNKKIVIEDPSIITQDRADWLAMHSLFTYSKVDYKVSIDIPADLGLQLYDTIVVEDIKTQAISTDTYFYTSSINEEWSESGYTMKVNCNSRQLPNSYVPRAVLSNYDLWIYFDNKPVYFEELHVPLVRDNTGYDPMTSEDDKYIDFEWTLLVAGFQFLEIFDTYIGGGSYDLGTRSPSYGSDNLISVPFLSRAVSSPGTYRARWDGVYDNHKNSDLYKGTFYSDIHKLPDGNGFFARGQDTTIIDEVDFVSIEEDNLQQAKRAYFPFYPTIKFQPVDPEHSSVQNTYYFGESCSDQSAFYIKHFQLEPRVPLVWDFTEASSMIPTDAPRFYRDYISPYSFNDNSSRFTRTEVRTQEEIENNDLTYTTMKFDCIPPYGFDGTWNSADSPSMSVYRMATDQVGIRIYTDTEEEYNRKFYISKANLIYTVTTVVVDQQDYNVNWVYIYNYADGNMWSPDYCYLKRKSNLVSCQVSEPQSLDSYITGKFYNETNEWTLLANRANKDTTESLLFAFTPEEEPATLRGFTQGTVKGQGINVSNVSAIPFAELKNLTLSGLPHLVNNETNINVPFVEWRYPVPRGWYVMPGQDSGTYCGYIYDELMDDVLEIARRDCFPDAWGENFPPFYKGKVTYGREIFNTVLISLELYVIDRAGRSYFSAAYADSGRFFPGKHNEIEIHSEYTPELMGFVNRYNPYLPTINYFGKNNLGNNWEIYIDGFGNEQLADPYVNYIDASAEYHTFNAHWKEDTTITSIPFSDSFAQANIGTKVSASRVDMVEGIPYLKTLSIKNPLKNLSSPGPYNMPRFVNGTSYDGVVAGIFGDDLYRQNSYVFYADEAYPPDSIVTRDHTSGTHMTSYGIPFYIQGGYTEVRPYPSDYSGTFDMQLRRLWFDKYIKDRHPETQEEVTPTRQRAGIWSWCNMSPTFINVGSGLRYADCTIDKIGLIPPYPIY